MYDRILFSLRKRKNSICNNMDGPERHFTKWHKLRWEIQYCMISLTWNIKKIDIIESERRLMVVRVWKVWEMKTGL